LEAQRYRDRATEYLKLAENAQASDVRERYRKVAQHYLDLVEQWERSAKQGDNNSPRKR
jgi:hypothetical protein